MDKAGACYLRNMLIRARQKRREEAQASRENVISLQAYRHSNLPPSVRAVPNTASKGGRPAPRVHEHPSRAHLSGPE